MEIARFYVQCTLCIVKQAVAGREKEKIDRLFVLSCLPVEVAFSVAVNFSFAFAYSYSFAFAYSYSFAFAKESNYLVAPSRLLVDDDQWDKVARWCHEGMLNKWIFLLMLLLLLLIFF